MHCEYRVSARLFGVESGALIWDRFFCTYMEQPTDYVVSIDADTRVERVLEMDQTDGVSGTWAGTMLCAGCLVFSRKAATAIYQSETCRDARWKDPESWIVAEPCRVRVEVKKLTSTDATMLAICKRLGIPMYAHTDMDIQWCSTEWSGEPNRFAISHPVFFQDRAPDVTVVQHGVDIYDMMLLAMSWNGGILKSNRIRYTPNIQYRGTNGACVSEWARYDLVLHEWAKAKVIWWFDTDVLIESQDIDLSWPLSVDADFGIDKPGNTGVFWVKTNAKGRALMERLAYYGHAANRDERMALISACQSRVKSLPLWRAWVPFDQIASYDEPERLGVRVCYFGREWNHWDREHHRVELDPQPKPVQIRAWHGKRYTTKLLAMRTFCGRRTFAYDADPALFEAKDATVIQHGVGDADGLMRLVAPWHEALAKKCNFNYMPNSIRELGRASEWARFSLILDAWNKSKVIWWLDADAAIVSPCVNLTWPLEVDADIGFDSTGNSGVFWIKTNERAFEMISQIARYTVEDRALILQAARAEGEALQKLNPSRSLHPLDIALFNIAYRTGLSVHLFGGEWNYWRRGAPVQGETQIRAFHGERRIMKERQMAALTGSVSC